MDKQFILSCFGQYCGQEFAEPLPPDIRAALEYVVHWEQRTGKLFDLKYLNTESMLEVIRLLRPHIVIRIVNWNKESLPSWEEFQRLFD